MSSRGLRSAAQRLGAARLLQGTLRGLARALHGACAARGGAAPLRAELALLRRAQPPQLVPPPAARSALILAPHMDDEVLGCGATAAAMAARGCAVHVAYLTDGRKGHDGDPPGPGSLGQRETQLALLRREEARRAGKRLGWSALHFLDLPDGALEASPHAVQRLAPLLAETRPELVFLPFFTDLHPDHRAASALLAAAAQRAALPPHTPCWAYEVWWPLPASVLVDAAPTMALKCAALAEFASQNHYVDYPRASEGLARYRSLLSGAGGRGFAEAFFVADLALYTDLCREAGVLP